MATNFVSYQTCSLGAKVSQWQKWGKITYPPAFIALSIQNGMGYHYLNVRVNSANDASILCKNIEFWSSNSRENGAHLYTFLRHGKKNWQVSQDILDQFLQSFHHMKAL